MYVSTPMQELPPASTGLEPREACDAACTTNGQCPVLVPCEGGDRICTETQFLTGGKHKPHGLASIWGCSSIPPLGQAALLQLGAALCSWKSREIRLFPSLSKQDRQCSRERSHHPCPRVFKQGHVLLPRTPQQTPFPVLSHLAWWLGWGERGTRGSKTQGRHLEVHHCLCPNWDQPLGEGTKVERPWRDEGRDGERAG